MKDEKAEQGRAFRSAMIYRNDVLPAKKRS